MDYEGFFKQHLICSAVAEEVGSEVRTASRTNRGTHAAASGANTVAFHLHHGRHRNITISERRPQDTRARTRCIARETPKPKAAATHGSARLHARHWDELGAENSAWAIEPL